jgi:Mn2+/Fe2+ NRAMP family transporter
MEMKSQSSFELLVTMTFGLAILLPLVIIAFLQLSNSNTSLSAAEAQQAANKLSSIATLVGTEGPPAKQVVQIQVPPQVQFIFV